MSIYSKYLGSDFGKLHPMMQRRFGLGPEDGVYMLGRGMMTRIWNAGLHTRPFLYLGTRRNIMFPETGRDIPFTIENYAYYDTFGRETVAWIRKFDFPGRSRNFDATMVHSPERGTIVDYLGTMQHMVVDIAMKANDDGSMTITSTNQRMYIGKKRLVFPNLFSGDAEVNERYDEDKKRFGISVMVGNRTFGEICGYEGYFVAEYKGLAPGGVPAYVRPLREERRE